MGIRLGGHGYRESSGQTPRECLHARNCLSSPAAQEFPFGAAEVRQRILNLAARVQILIEDAIRAADVARHQACARRFHELSAAVEATVFFKRPLVVLLGLCELPEIEMDIA